MQRIKKSNKRLFAIVVGAFVTAIMLVSFISLPHMPSAQAETYPTGSPAQLAFDIHSKLDVEGGINASDLDEADWEGSLAQFKDYISGVCLTGSDTPAIILHLTGENADSANTEFYFRMQSKIGEVGADEDWQTIEDIDKNDNFAILFAEDVIGNNTGYFQKYFFFKAVITKVNEAGATVREELINDKFVDIIIDKTATSNVYDITSIESTYLSGSGVAVYPTENPIWTASNITFTIKSRAENEPNVTHYYSIAQDSNKKPIWIPAERRQAIDGSGLYYSIAIISETYQGEVMFAASNLDSSIFLQSQSRKNIQVDKAIPDFGISATKNNGTEPYYFGAPTGANSDSHWSSTDVNYTLIPAESGICISGAKYFYNKNNEYKDGQLVWDQIMPVTQPSGNIVYSLTLSESVRALRFRGVSNAGLESTNNTDFITNIDKEKPTLNLYAEDALQRIVRSGGYASDSVTFTLANDNKNSKANVYFEYKIDGIHTEYQKIVSNAGTYKVVGRQPIVNKTYHFRARSQAGLTDNIAFTVSALDSKFSLTMDDPKFDVNADGWAKEQIEIFLNVPNVLGTDDEYAFYSAVLGNNTTLKQVSASVVGIFNVGNVSYKKYKVYIDTSLDSNIMTFYAVNKALDKSQVLNTQSIKLDLKQPEYTAIAWMYNSGIQLSTDDWANGRVVIRMTPQANISGLRCYPLLGNVGSGVNGREIIMKDGIFIFEVVESGVYSFRITSGAGLSTEKTVVVNIDTSDIEFNDIKAYVNDVEIGTDGSNAVASDVLIEFFTNHQTHFDYFWQNYSGLTPIEGAYTKGTASTFIIKPDTDGTITKRYAFYLQSKAVDASGNRYKTNVKTITIKFDAKNFSIQISYDQTILTGWRSGAIEFAFSDEFGGTDLSKYQFQMSLDDKIWTDISLSGSNTFSFTGVNRYYNNTLIGQSYQGGMLFRAINKAGHACSPVGIETGAGESRIRIDNTNVDPFFGLNINAGGTVLSLNEFQTVYANKKVVYQNTTAAAGKPVFANMSPIKYYYAVYNNATAPSIGDANVYALDAGTIKEFGSLDINSPEDKYWLIAVNGVGITKAVKYNFIIEKINLTASLQGGAGGALGSSGIYEYNWADSVNLFISVKSDTSVYFWYKLGDGEWIKYNAVADNLINGQTVNKELYFLSEQNTLIPNAAIVGNIDCTVSFKISNYSGSEKVLDEKIRIRLDVGEPEFEVVTTVGGQIVTDRDKWYAEAVFITLLPQGNHPSGVIYEYRTIDAGENQKLPGNGTYFSTDDLITFEGNGIVTIWITATVRATGEYKEYELTLSVDKIVPEFILKGEITVSGTSNTKEIVSGEWAKAKEVTITKDAKSDSKSGVVYTYTYSTKPVGSVAETWPKDTAALIVKEICVLTVVATSGSGLVVTKTFAVNIDEDPPVINSGVIKNVMKQLPDGTWVIDKENAQRYYIDQVITFIEPNLKSARYNNYPLSNGAIIATNTVDNSNGGYVHIIIEDMAGNIAELVFYMTIFDLDVNNITLGEDDLALLESFKNDFENAESGLTASRREYFRAYIARLGDRLSTLRKQINGYQTYLEKINDRESFNLKSDYDEMYTYINYFTTADTTILYPQWQQDQIREGKYDQYYNKLVDRFEQLRLLMAVVVTIERNTASLPATNVVERDDYPSILRVYDDYEAMTIDQKSVFKPTLYTKLTEVKRRCEVLRLQDPTTNIKIEGDDLTPGLEIVVETLFKGTGNINEAQKVLLNTFPEGLPRTIIAVNNLKLAGLGSQFQTGEITITLPIPEGYYEYIQFAVYTLSADGTITPIDGVTISPDGKSVYFKTNGMNTFILATNANTTVREDSGKIYGTIFGIEIDGKLLTYITFVSIGLFVLLLVILIVVGIKQRWFLKTYNKAYKRRLDKRGIKKIPKGNPPALTNPAKPGELARYEDRIYQNDDK